MFGDTNLELKQARLLLSYKSFGMILRDNDLLPEQVIAVLIDRGLIDTEIVEYENILNEEYDD